MALQRIEYAQHRRRAGRVGAVALAAHRGRDEHVGHGVDVHGDAQGGRVSRRPWTPPQVKLNDNERGDKG